MIKEKTKSIHLSKVLTYDREKAKKKKKFFCLQKVRRDLILMAFRPKKGKIDRSQQRIEILLPL